MSTLSDENEAHDQNECHEDETANEIIAKLDELTQQIDAAISEIREYIQVKGQENLLMIVSDLSTYSNPTRIEDALVFGSAQSLLRPVEYLQSLISAREMEEPTAVTDVEIEALANRYLDDYEALYELTQEYLLTWTTAHIADDNVLTVMEAQLTQAVRGNRYEFLQSDYFKPLLAPHDDEFQKLFSMSSDEVMEGLEKLLSAIGHGRLAAFNELGCLFDQDLLSESFELSSSDPVLFEKASNACLDAFTVQHFDVKRITGWPTKFIEGLAFKPGEGEFFEKGRMAYWPIVALPIQRRPFITLNGATYCFDYYMLTDHFYRSVQKLMLNEDPDYAERWQERQKDASESMVEGIFKQLLPGCTTFANNYFDAKGRSGENDLLILFHDALMIVEIKAGQFTVVPPLSDFQAHIARYKDLVEKPNSQCARMRKHVQNANGELALFDSSGNKKGTLDISGISTICCISVTIENINTFASRAEKLGFLQLEQGVACIAVDDLMTYAKYFENPLMFLHFLKQREAASTKPKLIVNDELDHLGLYISHNCYAMEVDRAEESDFVVAAGYREELDNYFETIGAPVPTPPKPQQEIPPRFMEIIDVPCSNDAENCVTASFWLLDFSSEAREQLAVGIDRTLYRQKETGKQCVFSFSGKEGTIQLTAFIMQRDLTAPFTAQNMRDYATSLMLAHGQESRAVLTLSYDRHFKLTEVRFEMLSPDSVPAEQVASLKKRGEDLCDALVERHKNLHGKIGRNEPCPCGSGKKYKRCHGRG